MQPNNTIPELTKEELEIYLLIYAAHVDYEFSEDEREFIMQRTSKKTYDKSFYDMKELYDLKDISEKIEGNYDLLCIIFLINICNSYLNEIPKELVLNKEDKDFFNAKHKLYELILFPQTYSKDQLSCIGSLSSSISDLFRNWNEVGQRLTNGIGKRRSNKFLFILSLAIFIVGATVD